MVRFHPWPWWWGPEDEGPVEDSLYSQKLLLAGFAGMVATAVLHPLDLLKTRIQISARPQTVQFMFKRVILSEGYKGLYKGLSAGLFRQATTTFTRLGVYNYLNEQSKKLHNRPLQHTVMSDRIQVGVWAGMAGSAVGSPAELVLTRMMAASRCPSTHHPCVRDTKPRPYRNCADGILRIVREEGFFTLWRGVTLTLTRSVVITSCQIGSYLYFREQMVKRQLIPADSAMKLHTASCTISSFITAFLSLPVDLVKSWYQISRRGVTIREVVSCLIQSKGKQYLWSGFWPYYLRMVAYTVSTYYIITEFSEFYKKYKKKKEEK